MRKHSSVAIAIALTASLLAACTGGGASEPAPATPPAGGGEAPAPAETGGEKVMEEVHLVSGWNADKGRVVDRSGGMSLYDKFMKERWNMTFEWNDIPGSNFVEQANLLFATGEYPDWFWRANKNQVDSWGAEGYLYDYSQDWSKVQNFRDLFTDEQWEEVLRRITSPDGGVYFIPRVDRRINGELPVTLMWNYKKSAWDALGLEFPKTTDELYEALKKIKENDPSAVPLPGRWDITGATYGLVNAFRTSLTFLEDPDQNDELVYGPVSDKFRDMLVYVNKLYAEGLLDKDFLTQTDDQWKQDVGSGTAYIQFGTNYYHMFNTLDADGGWTYAPHYISAYEGKGAMLGVGSGVQTYGPIITDKASDVERERLLEYINWSFTREGLDLHLYGVEGETYTIDADGNRVPTEIVNDNYTGYDKGKDLVTYGFQYLSLEEYQPRDIANNPWIEELTNQLRNDPNNVFIRSLGFVFTEDEAKDLADVKTLVEDAMKRNVAEFIMGNKDPNNDGDWDKYMSEMKTAGLDRYIALHTAAYERSYK